MHHCRFCGQKTKSDDSECPHCGKQIGDKKVVDDGIKLTNLDTWQNKSYPAWVMYAVVAFFLGCLVLVVVRGCEVEVKEPAESHQTASDVLRSAKATLLSRSERRRYPHRVLQTAAADYFV